MHRELTKILGAWPRRVAPRRRGALCCAVVALWVSALAGEAGISERLVAAAREQIGVTVLYDGAYRVIPYPNGDISAQRGVCTDVLIRAYRRLGVDLQRLVHEDMVSAWSAYPRLWSLARPDPNIDHRRVPNLVTFFARHGEVVPVQGPEGAFIPGDLVTWRLPSGVPHIGIVSDHTAPSGSPLVIHNIGRGTVEEDILFRFPITGHFRYPRGSGAHALLESRRAGGSGQNLACSRAIVHDGNESIWIEAETLESDR